MLVGRQKKMQRGYSSGWIQIITRQYDAMDNADEVLSQLICTPATGSIGTVRIFNETTPYRQEWKLIDMPRGSYRARGRA
jgi:hypothetical protein